LEPKKILVSQPKPASDKSPYYDIMRKYNVDITFRPLIKVVSVSPKEFRQQKISILNHTAIIFTSRHAIDHFFTLCEEMRLTIPEDMKYFCITESVALYIQKYTQYRKRKVFFGQTGKIEGLIPAISKHNKESYFVPMSDVHNDQMKDMLDSLKVSHTEGVMYRTVSDDFAEDEVFDYDLVIFFSPSGVHSILKNFPNFAEMGMEVATFGKSTAQTVKDAHLNLTLEAPTPTAPSMTAALEQYIKENMK